MTDQQRLAFSRSVKRDAEALLKQSKILPVLKSFGDLHFAGSFAGDVMWSPDIDIYVVGKFSRQDALALHHKLAEPPFFRTHLFCDWKKFHDPALPAAYYIGLKVPWRKKTWKIDIWLLTESQIRQMPFTNLEELVDSEEKRKAILRFKEFNAKKQPAIPGLLAYDAVLEKGLTTISAYKEYLSKSESFYQFGLKMCRPGV